MTAELKITKIFCVHDINNSQKVTAREGLRGYKKQQKQLSTGPTSTLAGAYVSCGLGLPDHTIYLAPSVTGTGGLQNTGQVELSGLHQSGETGRGGTQHIALPFILGTYLLLRTK
jgi:hypothetical protein